LVRAVTVKMLFGLVVGEGPVGGGEGLGVAAGGGASDLQPGHNEPKAPVRHKFGPCALICPKT